MSVYRRISSGQLIARLDNREYRIEEAELERYIAALPSTAPKAVPAGGAK